MEPNDFIRWGHVASEDVRGDTGGTSGGGGGGGGGVSASYVLSLVFKQNGERHKALHSHLLLGRSSLPLYEDLKKRFSSWAELWNSK